MSTSTSMSASDTSEKGLESLIERSLIEEAGYLAGSAKDYDRAHCLDAHHLFAFLRATQPETLARLEARHGAQLERKLLDRIAEQVGQRGVVDALRHGVKDGPEEITLYYPRPVSSRNPLAAARYAANRFAVTRQVRYSENERQRALDLVISINGLPLATFELKNQLTKQNVKDAMRQYQEDRDPREPLFAFGRCLVHFAVDDDLVYMTTHLRGEGTSFLPFNQGYREGAGNPPNPAGIKTDYLWKQVLAKDSLADIVEQYAQLVVETDRENRKRKRLIFPRYHQLDLVRKLLADAQARGVGRRYLVQHSAGSGKSNSISWLAHQAVELSDPSGERPVFDSVVVVTDRTVLDKQIRDTIKQFAHVAGVVQPITEGSRQLRDALEEGKKIVVTTIQKFPYIAKEIKALGDKRFAIIIDEAHSSQSGRAAAQMNAALGRDAGEEEPETFEDQINRIIEEQRLLSNASYFAFTATPKSKTLETFGERSPVDGTFRPFHTYSMKQAIEEEFILDVLEQYTTYASYYNLVKRIEDDPEFDTARARKKLRKYVEQHPAAIERKARIMVDHFLSEVIARRKVGGQARAMVVTGSIAAAIRYKLAFDAYLREIKSPFKAIVAFTGEKKEGEQTYDEQRMNGFPSGDIPERFAREPYRFLIVAEKFQTGFDQPLLHTMYVDKVLSDVKAVQTLSRLNRAYKPWKSDTFVLDFVNTADQIQRAFEPFYRTTILSEQTDLNRLNDLADALDRAQVYTREDVEALMARYLGGAARDQLDPILDRCADAYRSALTGDEQIDFKAKAKAFVRIYQYLVMIQDFSKPSWESLKTFLKLLLTKLPAPDDEDLARGVLESVDMASYRAEQQETRAIRLTGDEGLEPTPAGTRAGQNERQMDRLSAIIREFNERYATDWTDNDRIRQLLFEDLPAEVSQDEEYQNAKRFSDRQNASITHGRKLEDKFQEIMLSQTDLYRRFTDDPEFKRWLCETLFRMDYDAPGQTPG